MEMEAKQLELSIEGKCLRLLCHCLLVTKH